MPINCINNDQNIIRVYPKMSELFSGQKNTKLSNSVASTNYFIENCAKITKHSDDFNLSYDHMYATNTENGELNPSANCQSADSEVKFWKEWLILHLDLIQQQSDEILSKERTILILQQENEMLKERISCMERGDPYQPNKFFKNHSAPYLKDMTQDSSLCDEDNKHCVELITLNCENAPIKLNSFQEDHRISDSESQEKPVIDNKPIELNFHNNSGAIKREIIEIECKNTSEDFGFTISNSVDLESMKNLRMSIRRKRLSNSSALSNNDSIIDEKRSFRRFKKRRKRVVKDTHVLTTPDPYITEAGESSLGSTNAFVPVEISNNRNLEVPRWRTKVYASCYSMEGTENLDDEVYNKRHSRLENDERKRKRWDVQRIREQRVVEKLKQRQERIGSGSRVDDQKDPLNSLWPTVEDIHFLEVSEELPVAAFGYTIPKIPISEFILPWFNNPTLLMAKRVPGRRSTVRRKNAKR